MAKTFKGFTNQQTHQLLKELGFTGPAQKDDMDLFLASSPSAASKIGRYAEIAKQRVEGGPLSGMGMQAGGAVSFDSSEAAFNSVRSGDLDIKNIPIGTPMGDTNVQKNTQALKNAGYTIEGGVITGFNQANETALSNYDPNNPEFLVGPGGGVRNPNYTGPVSDQPSLSLIHISEPTRPY